MTAHEVLTHSGVKLSYLFLIGGVTEEVVAAGVVVA
jgi:hypothetical protein